MEETGGKKEKTTKKAPKPTHTIIARSYIPPNANLSKVQISIELHKAIKEWNATAGVIQDKCHQSEM